MKKLFTLMLVALLMMSFAGCGNKNGETKSNTVNSSSTNESKTLNSNSTNESNTESRVEERGALPDLKVRFGPNGNGFTLKLYKNDTAAQIVKYVGEADWNLPIYHFNDFENYEVMQYYDIPSRYNITSHPEKVTSEKAGELYYSAPNRIILFYQDAKVTGEFTKIGYLENTDGLKEAVEKNPVVEGWSNKIISISPAK